MIEIVVILGLIFIILVMIFHRQRPRHRSPFDRKCPFCREVISGSATACPCCGRDVPRQKWIWEKS